jgi:hypothetical protein
MPSKASPKSVAPVLDLVPYVGRWVAIVRGQITGVGASEQEARLASKYQRPKEEPRVMFVDEGITKEK